MSHKHQSKHLHKEQHEDFFRSINIQFLIHELKGPLDVLETNLKMLEKSVAEEKTSATFQRKVIERSKRNATKLREIILSLLEVGTSQSGQLWLQHFKVTDTVFKILLDSLDTTSYGKVDISPAEAAPVEVLQRSGIELNIQEGLTGLSSCQDKTKFTYILGNLVRNALHHRTSSVRISLTMDEKNLLFDIIDDGPGVTPDEQRHIFQCYSQDGLKTKSKRKGHGLGLASSRIMARHLGGDIILVHRDTNGAHFSLHLPIHLDIEAAKEAGYEVHLQE